MHEKTSHGSPRGGRKCVTATRRRRSRSQDVPHRSAGRRPHLPQGSFAFGGEIKGNETIMRFELPSDLFPFGTRVRSYEIAYHVMHCPTADSLESETENI